MCVIYGIKKKTNNSISCSNRCFPEHINLITLYWRIYNMAPLFQKKLVNLIKIRFLPWSPFLFVFFFGHVVGDLRTFQLSSCQRLIISLQNVSELYQSAMSDKSPLHQWGITDWLSLTWPLTRTRMGCPTISHDATKEKLNKKEQVWRSNFN